MHVTTPHTCSKKSCPSLDSVGGSGGSSSVASSLNSAWLGFGHAGLPVAISSTAMPSDQMSACSHVHTQTHVIDLKTPRGNDAFVETDLATVLLGALHNLGGHELHDTEARRRGQAHNYSARAHAQQAPCRRAWSD
jgi:hypothetical protein